MIQNIEKKIKLSLAISVGSFVTSIIIAAMTFVFAYGLVNEQRKSIYVLDHNVPVLVRQTDLGTNRDVEYKSHVNMFHQYFFTLPPDDDHIKSNISKAMYLVDDSGLAQYNNLKENGYYNSILSSSTHLNIQADSITVDENRHFTYYATQRIERPSSIATRALITEGDLQDVPRSENNPHGLIIKNWKPVFNKDLKYVGKKNF